MAVLLPGSLLAAAYVMRVLGRAFTSVDKPAFANPVPPVMERTAVTLALLAAVLGLVAQWPADLLQTGAPVAAAGWRGGAAP